MGSATGAQAHEGLGRTARATTRSATAQATEAAIEARRHRSGPGRRRAITATATTSTPATTAIRISTPDPGETPVIGIVGGGRRRDGPWASR